MEVDNDDNNDINNNTMNTMADECNNLRDLPKEILCSKVGREWLTSKDVISLSRTSHKLNTSLGLGSIHYNIPGNFEWVGRLCTR